MLISFLRNRAQRRFKVWLDRRIKRVPGPMRIERNRIYILPTRYGLGFGLLVFVMLMGSMNFSNSLGFALTFLLTGIGLIAMHHTHRNLLNLRVAAGRHEPVFAGGLATFQILLQNDAPKHRYSLRIATEEDGQRPEYIDVPAAGHAICTIRCPAPKRGWRQAPRFSLRTEFPLGLFHAWTWIELDMRCLVYPKPADSRLQPPPTAGEKSGRRQQQSGREDYAGLREYALGDPTRLIHWKRYPATGQLVIKQFADPREEELWLDWESLKGMDTEARLSQLCRWVLDAHRSDMGYGLRLPGLEIAPAHGAPHRNQCLEALALHET